MASAAFTLWHIDGNAEECVKKLSAMLDIRDDEHTRIDVIRLLWQMGPPAKDAVPGLVRAMESDNQATREFAMGAVGGIRSRPDIAVPALVKALKAGNGSSSYAVEALGEFGPDARPAVPALKAHLGETKGHERVDAAFALWKIEGKAEVVVPVLIDEFKSGEHYRAARRLGEIGPPAKAAIPVLTLAAKNDVIPAAGALWRITKEPEPALSTCIRVLTNKDAKDPSSAVAVLAEIGPQAKAAVPALLAAYRAAQRDRYSSLPDDIEAALRKIDPDAAKKAGIR